MKKLFRKYNFRVRNMEQFSKSCMFTAEELSSIGKAKVLKTAYSIGAHSYIGSGLIYHVEKSDDIAQLG